MPKILVVDDEQNMRTGLKDNLEFEGYDVETANDGEQGLKKIIENSYNLIILDVMMPEVDGWELLVRLRQYMETTETIILICSILPLGDLARSLGANGFLQKPVAPQDLLQELNAHSAHLASSP